MKKIILSLVIAVSAFAASAQTRVVVRTVPVRHVVVARPAVVVARPVVVAPVGRVTVVRPAVTVVRPAVVPVRRRVVVYR